MHVYVILFFAISFAWAQVILGDQLIVLNVPSGVQLSTNKEASFSDVQALSYQLFGLDETQSRILSDVSFFRRPSLLAVITVACGADSAAACVDAFAAGSKPPGIRLDGGSDQQQLTFRPASSLAESLANARLDKSVVAGTSGLPDSTNPALFTGLNLASADSLPAALPDEAGLPVASGLLADSQPDALQLDISGGGDASATLVPAGGARRVAEFAADLADRLATAAGRDRAFIAVLLVTADAAAPVDSSDLTARVGRSLLTATDSPVSTVAPPGGMNLAPNYSQDFPVMFNLILWLSVVLALAVYAVAYGLWNIDPGKDSIIYRRGYAHAKKD